MYTTDMARYTTNEEAFIHENYDKLGPKSIGRLLGRTMKSVSKKASRMGLVDGYERVSISNRSRRNAWEFSDWSLELAYVCGVYLGDGNAYLLENSGYFALGSIDRDFCVEVNKCLHKITGYTGSIAYREPRYPNRNGMYTLRLCNRDFTYWLTSKYGSAGNKAVQLTGKTELDLEILSGLWDSDGTSCKYTMNIRTHLDLRPPVYCGG